MRFTIRDLLWLTVVVALGLACWAARSEADRLRVAVTRLHKQCRELELDNKFLFHLAYQVAPELCQGMDEKDIRSRIDELEKLSMEHYGPGGSTPNPSAPAPYPPKD